MTSTPSTARSSPSPVERSPRTAPGCSLRLSTRTSRPAPRRRSATRRPSEPVPPVIRNPAVLIMVSSFPSCHPLGEAVSGYGNRPWSPQASAPPESSVALAPPDQVASQDQESRRQRGRPYAGQIDQHADLTGLCGLKGTIGHHHCRETFEEPHKPESTNPWNCV